MNDTVAAARTGALAAHVLGKILEIALLLLRFFLRAHSRLRSVGAPGLVSPILPCLLSPLGERCTIRFAGIGRAALALACSATAVGQGCSLDRSVLIAIRGGDASSAQGMAGASGYGGVGGGAGYGGSTAGAPWAGTSGSIGGNPAGFDGSTAGEPSDAGAHADAALPPGMLCNPLGAYAVRIDSDVYWGARTEGLAALVDSGRGIIRVELLVRVPGVAADGTYLNSGARPCNVELPVFYTSLLCEAYASYFDVSIWESPLLPTFPVTGRFTCTDTSCEAAFHSETTLLGIDLDDPNGDWPTPDRSPYLTCPYGSNADCFPDHDANGHPGVTVRLRTDNAALPEICFLGGMPAGPFTYRAAPLNSNPTAIFDGVRRTDRIHLGTRTRFGGLTAVSEDCNSGAGPAFAEYFETRAYGCGVEPGTADWPGPVAGPDEPCDEAQRLFMDENLPLYFVLSPGEIPPAEFLVPDMAPSPGPRASIVRLGPPDGNYSCEQVRRAPYI